MDGKNRKLNCFSVRTVEDIYELDASAAVVRTIDSIQYLLDEVLPHSEISPLPEREAITSLLETMYVNLNYLNDSLDLVQTAMVVDQCQKSGGCRSLAEAKRISRAAKKIVMKHIEEFQGMVHRLNRWNDRYFSVGEKKSHE